MWERDQLPAETAGQLAELAALAAALPQGRSPSGAIRAPFRMTPYSRRRLIEGEDETELTLRRIAEISSYAQQRRTTLPPTSRRDSRHTIDLIAGTSSSSRAINQAARPR
jgi:hypothetical protein